MKNQLSKNGKIIFSVAAVIVIIVIILLLVLKDNDAALVDTSANSTTDSQVSVPDKPRSWFKKSAPATTQTQSSSQTNQQASATTYTYRNHGFAMELPSGFVPKETKLEKLPITIITLPSILNAQLQEQEPRMYFISDKAFAYQNGGYCQIVFSGDRSTSTELSDQVKIGSTSFQGFACKDTQQATSYYLYEQGNYAYIFPSGAEYYNFMKSFKFVGGN